MENRKIKSVKLAKDYRTANKEILKGQQLYYYNHYWNDAYNVFEKGNVSFHESEVSENKTGLFEIEYYNEHFEYHEKLNSADKNFIDAVVNAENQKNKDFLNQLADWCDAKCKFYDINKHFLIALCGNNGLRSCTVSEWLCGYGMILFNSFESAELFLSELSRDENKEVREYFINLPKSKRLT